ncbi:MAG: phosphatase PAP2 family protein [Eubacterium sp.]|nr:phosphatase PAP2 family protein [Eubacterium sp.]
MEASILLFFQDHVRCGFLTPIMEVFTWLVGFKGVFVIALALLLIVIKKTRWVGISVATAVALSGLFTNLIIKKIVDRPRPFTEIPGLTPISEYPTDGSFPSGHTSLAFCLATVLLLTLPWIIEKKKAHRLGALFLVIALVVGVSRLYLGVHYPTDVFCGILLGIAYGIAAAAIVGAIKKRVMNPSKEEDSQ